MIDKKLIKEDPQQRQERLRFSSRLSGRKHRDKTKFQRHLKHKKGTTDVGSFSFCIFESFRWILAAFAMFWIACYSSYRIGEVTSSWKTDFLQLQKTK